MNFSIIFYVVFMESIVSGCLDGREIGFILSIMDERYEEDILYSNGVYLWKYVIWNLDGEVYVIYERFKFFLLKYFFLYDNLWFIN